MHSDSMNIAETKLNAGYAMSEASGSNASRMGTIEREISNSNNINVISSTRNMHDVTETSIHNGGPHVTSHTNDEGSQIFTVERKEQKHAKQYKRKKTYFLSAFKSILSILISLVLFACVVASKLSLVHIGQKLNYTAITITNSSSRVTNHNGSQRETSLVMLIMILVCPSVYTFIRAFCISGMKRSHPWPTRKAVIWGIVGTFIETAGLSLYTVGVLSVIQEANVAIVLMNALFIAPVFWQMSKACMERFASKYDPKSRHLQEKTRRKHVTNMLLSFFAIILQIGGLVGIVFLTSNKEILDIKFILVPISIILLSAGWCPKLKKLQIDHDLAFVMVEQKNASRYNEEINEFNPATVEPDLSLNGNSILRSGISRQNLCEDGKRKKSWKDDTQKVIFESNTSRGKAAVINSFFKIIFTPLCCVAVAYFMKVADIKNLHLGLNTFFNDKTLYAMFFLQITSGFVGYHLAWLACTMTMQRLCFALPLTLATPAAVILLVTNRCTNAYASFLKCSQNNPIWLYIALFSVALWLGQFLATTYYAWKNQDFIMANEAVLFWTPSYEGVMLEQNLLLNRKNEATNEYFVSYRSLVKDSRIYICTTMYHEEAYEMEQLLNSIGSIDCARKEAGRKFEAHIFFDDGVRDKTLKKYALQLVSLLEDTLDIKPSFAQKIETPYGMELKWKLPGGMDFHVHLKDNYKVKNKKRWSQVMYMSYILDFRERGKCDHAYILTTDADVRFRPDDVMALMDLMSRDPTVGAVCGRTHPMGSGPLVWYQIFDYAIGHWLLKVAENILGSVLCSPGCFSIHRARAIQDVLPTYASHVECAMDFLTKDMGEDRWLCTLMIEYGWKLEYCAAAQNSTYCPDSFDEFFKQRRRWTPSTLANQIVLIQKAGKIRKSNDVISIGYIFYQLLLMISTIVGPANVMLVIASGLNYAFPKTVNLIAMFVAVLVIVAAFIVVCIYASQEFQLKVAKMLTLSFSIVMTITTVGLMAQMTDADQRVTFSTASTVMVADDIAKQLRDTSQLHLSPSTIYLLFMCGLFSATAILHGLEGTNLIHGLWYLLCLPSGYLFLTIYSIANLTDRSWGTRESKANSTSPNAVAWYRIAWGKLKTFCGMCCQRKFYDDPQRSEIMLAESDLVSESCDLASDVDLRGTSSPDMRNSESEDELGEREKPPRPPKPPKIPSKLLRLHSSVANPNDKMMSIRRNPHKVTIGPGTRFKSFKTHLPRTGADKAQGDTRIDTAVPIADFLHGKYKDYVENFKDNGYDDTTFLLSMKEQELLDIGLINRGHRKKILVEIEKLPPEEMDQEVPDNVRDWLIKLGLENYWQQFEENSYTEPNTLADLKFMDKNTIMQTFKITKQGHVKKLAKAINFLAYPNAAQTNIRKARIELDKASVMEQEHTEYKFWERLRVICLLPEQAAFSQSDELRDKLEELRNSGLMMLIVINILWITIMLTIIAQGKKLQILNTNFLGLAFLFLYTVVLLVQFCTLLWHRVGTWIHLMSRTPFKPGSNINMSWSFHDDDLPPEPKHDDLFVAQQRLNSRLERRSRRRLGHIADSSMTFCSIHPPKQGPPISIELN